VGESAHFWTECGCLAVADQRWLALSGGPGHAYNLALCYGGDGPRDVEAVQAEIADSGVRVIAMLAGPALGWAQPLVDAGCTPVLRE